MYRSETGQPNPTRKRLVIMPHMTTEALLGRLIEHHTENPGGDEFALCEFLRHELTTRGADEVAISTVPRPKGGDIGAYIFARFGTPELLINVHIDTVPANTCQRKPLNPSRKVQPSADGWAA